MPLFQQAWLWQFLVNKTKNPNPSIQDNWHKLIEQNLQSFKCIGKLIPKKAKNNEI